MLDTEGNVVYSAFKGVDLGTNLFEGPYRLSNLSEAYRTAMDRNIVGDVVHRRLRRLQPEPRQSRRVGGDPHRRRRRGHRRARDRAADRPDQRRHDRRWRVGGERARQDGRDLHRRRGPRHAVDLAAAAGGSRRIRGGCGRRRSPAGRCRTERAERQHAPAADDRGRGRDAGARRRGRHAARARLSRARQPHRVRAAQRRRTELGDRLAGDLGRGAGRRSRTSPAT